jgi:hypothetical protein
MVVFDDEKNSFKASMLGTYIDKTCEFRSPQSTVVFAIQGDHDRGRKAALGNQLTIASENASTVIPLRYSVTDTRFAGSGVHGLAEDNSSQPIVEDGLS